MVTIPGQPPPGAGEVRLAIERGLVYLLCARDSEGFWQDFWTQGGVSDEWVTAYVAWCLTDVPNGGEAAAEAWPRLLSRRRASGWGYHSGVPADCDSTAWVCRLIERLGATSDATYQEAMLFLSAAARANGGVPTYATDRDIRRFTGLSGGWSFEGWTSPHVCVSANVAALRGVPRRETIRQFVRQSRQAWGAWEGYWWTQPAYPTMLACEALGVDELARSWAKADLDESAFGLACRLRMGAPVRSQLLALQLRDGSWPSSARLRVPPPSTTNPLEGPAALSVDHNRTYTTATAIRALALSL